MINICITIYEISAKEEFIFVEHDMHDLIVKGLTTTTQLMNFDFST